jgi:hypothetical protein
MSKFCPFLRPVFLPLLLLTGCWSSPTGSSSSLAYLEYNRVGGIAGINEILSISQDGAFRYTGVLYTEDSPFTGVLSAGEMKEIRFFVETEMARIKGDFYPDQPIADDFQIALSVTDEKGRITKVTAYGLHDAPAAYQRIHTIFSGLVTRLLERHYTQ